MEICTWKSEDAPDHSRWCARYMVPVREDKKKSRDQGRDGPHAVDESHEVIGGGKPSKMGFLPATIYGRTKDEVLAKAEAFWAKRQYDLAEAGRRRAESAARAAETRKRKAA